jgi:Ca2+:H+ antiporter
MSAHGTIRPSAWIFPLLSVLLFAGVTALHYVFVPSPAGLLFATALLATLFGTVFAAVHHADVIAARIGEPFGTLLLTLAVTVIEVALIESMMLDEKTVTTLVRDTVFAVVMIVCNALVGICILAGGLRYHEQDIRVSGSNLYLSVLAVLATITLILPNYTLTTPGPVFSTGQLGFVSGVTILLYGVFLYTQTVRHREYFVGNSTDESGHGPPVSNRMLLVSVGLLLVSLLAVVLLAKKFSQVVEAGAAMIGAPPVFAGVVVAILILLPESVAAVEAARKDNLQKSINLALGSSLATIGLTVPALAVAAYLLDKQLVLGLSAQNMVLLTLTLILCMLTLSSGRTNILFGLVHLVVFAVFIFLVFVP